MAYGTDTTGQGPSPMMVDVVARAKELRPLYLARGFILQGGYSFNDGPKEAEIMAAMLSDLSGEYEILTEMESMNTIEGALAILEIARAHGYTVLVVVDQYIHNWLVRYTFRKVFAKSGIRLKFFAVSTPFGGNSQERLNSAWRLSLTPNRIGWWPWEYLARAVTWLKLLRT